MEGGGWFGAMAVSRRGYVGDTSLSHIVPSVDTISHILYTALAIKHNVGDNTHPKSPHKYIKRVLYDR